MPKTPSINHYLMILCLSIALPTHSAQAAMESYNQTASITTLAAAAATTVMAYAGYRYYHNRLKPRIASLAATQDDVITHIEITEISKSQDDSKNKRLIPQIGEKYVVRPDELYSVSDRTVIEPDWFQFIGRTLVFSKAKRDVSIEVRIPPLNLLAEGPDLDGWPNYIRDISNDKNNGSYYVHVILNKRYAGISLTEASFEGKARIITTPSRARRIADALGIPYQHALTKPLKEAGSIRYHHDQGLDGIAKELDNLPIVSWAELGITQRIWPPEPENSTS